MGSPYASEYTCLQLHELVWGRHKRTGVHTSVIIPSICRYGIGFVVIQEIDLCVIKIGRSPERASARIVIDESHIFLEVGGDHGN